MNKEELDRVIKQTPNGKPRMALLRKAWELADQEKDYDAQISYRLDYVYQTTFYEDVLEIYVIYPEILKLHDKRINEYGYDTKTYDILWAYKGLLQCAMQFYQISIQQFETLWQDAKKRFLQNGYSLRPLYQKRYSFYTKIDEKEAEKAYKEFVNCQRGKLCDCHACERSSEVEYLLEIGEFDRAVSKAEPLMDGRLSCTEQPEAMMGMLLNYYIREILKGDRTHVESAAELCEAVRRGIEKKGLEDFGIAGVLMFYSLEHPTKALNYYKKNWTIFEETRNPYERYWFAIAALCFLKNLGSRKTYKMKLSPSFSFYNEADTYDVEMLRNYYKDAALDIAEKMDKRNGTTRYYDDFHMLLQIKE